MPEHVPRETPGAPRAPGVAGAIFGDRLALACRFADLLATDGVTRGLIGPREVPRLWERHLLNCAVLSDAVGEGSAVADVGSGAGLPGLVLAIRRPELRVTLIEPLLRRVTFLQEAVERLELTGVTVTRGRAEERHGHEDFDAVTSRAVAPLPRLLDWCVPLVRPGGSVLAIKGAGAAAELAAASTDLAAWGVIGAELLTLGTTQIDPPTTVVRVVATPRSRLRWQRQHQSSGRIGSPTRGRRRR